MDIPIGILLTSCVLGFVIVAFVLLLRWRQRTFSVFCGTGIQGPQPSLFNGNYDHFWTPDMTAVMSRWTKTFGDVYGFYNGDAPFVAVKDIELLRRVFVSDFASFTERGVVWHLLANSSKMKASISMSSGHWWKQIRRCVSQSFTPSKLKPVVPGMEAAVDRFLALLEEESHHGMTEVNTFPLLRRLAFDMASSTMLDVDLDVQANPNQPLFQEASTFLSGVASQLFNKTAQSLSSVKCLTDVLIRVEEALGWELLSRIARCAEPIVVQRKENPKLARSDLLQAMTDTEFAVGEDDTGSPKDKRRMTVEEVSLNCANVLQAGFDTVALTLSYCLFSLAAHTDVQERVRDEARTVLAKHGQLTYDAVRDLQYTAQVLYETLRRYSPVVAFTTRRASHDYQYGSLLIREGTSVMACSHLVHQDADLWPEPDQFDPDRFSPEEKATRDPICFQGYGIGPRNCVGMRLAQLEMALVLAKLVLRYTIHLGSKHERGKLNVRCYAIVAAPLDGVWVKLQRISED